MREMSLFEQHVRKNFPEMPLLIDAPMREHTAFRIGGPADLLAVPQSGGEIAGLRVLACGAGIPVLHIGNGTNLLVSDAGFRGLVIKTFDRFSKVSLTSDNEITAESGILLSRLAVFAKDRGLAGLEFAHGIPGTLGGAVCMNAGAYGGQMSDVVTASKCLGEDGTVCLLSADEHEFQYRHSCYQDQPGAIVLEVVIVLQPGDSREIQARMRELSEKRSKSQPLELPSAGSVFRRPENGFAGALIEQCGLKGRSIGGAQVSEKHAGFIVNRGGATCDDVLRLIELIQETVLRVTGVSLETEVKHISGN